MQVTTITCDWCGESINTQNEWFTVIETEQLLTVYPPGKHLPNTERIDLCGDRCLSFHLSDWSDKHRKLYRERQAQVIAT